MILIIGGFAQGKLHYVEQHYAQREDRQEVPVLDGTLRLASDSKITWATESAVETMPGKQTEQPTGRQTAGPQVIVNHLHRYIREQLRQGFLLDHAFSPSDPFFSFWARSRSACETRR